MTQQTADAPAPARPSRRSVAAGLAWAVPVIAVGAAAPRAAASPCNPQRYVIDWSGSSGTTYTRASSTAGLATVDPDGAGPVLPVTMAIATTFVGSMQAGSETGSNDNLRISTGQVGATGKPGLTFHQTLTGSYGGTPPQRGARQLVTFTFSEPVVGLSFKITDIDSNRGDFDDRIELSGSFGYAIANTYRLAGAGSAASPFAPTSSNRPVGTDSSDGNVTITYPGPITTFTMTYWNAVTSYSGVDRDQVVTFTDFIFDVLRNNC